MGVGYSPPEDVLDYRLDVGCFSFRLLDGKTAVWLILTAVVIRTAKAQDSSFLFLGYAYSNPKVKLVEPNKRQLEREN